MDISAVQSQLYPLIRTSTQASLFLPQENGQQKYKIFGPSFNICPLICNLQILNVPPVSILIFSRLTLHKLIMVPLSESSRYYSIILQKFGKLRIKYFIHLLTYILFSAQYTPAIFLKIRNICLYSSNFPGLIAVLIGNFERPKRNFHTKIPIAKDISQKTLTEDDLLGTWVGRVIFQCKILCEFDNNIRKNKFQDEKPHKLENRSKKHLTQEDKFIKYLKIDQKIESWKQISSRLISSFPGVIRTAKQCRERFINSSQFCDELAEGRMWSAQEDKLLAQLFLGHGSKWTSFTKYFIHRSENSIKNRFYGNIRKTVRKLSKERSQKPKPIKCEMLFRLFDLLEQIQLEKHSFLDIKIDESHTLFKLRKSVLQISFERPDTSAQQLEYLASQLHQINTLMRNLGILKIKNRQHWLLNKKRLQLIYKYENDVSSGNKKLLVKDQALEKSTPSTPHTESIYFDNEEESQMKLESLYLQLDCKQSHPEREVPCFLFEEVYSPLAYEQLFQ